MNKNNVPLFTYFGLFLLVLSIGILYQRFDSKQYHTSNPVNEMSAAIETSDLPAESTSDFFVDEKEEQPPKKVALTFDDGPHPVYTLKLLEGLTQRNVKATFFLIGESAEQNPDIVKKIHDAGHLIGNHTFTHVQLTCIDGTKALEEICKTNDVIYCITGEPVRFIRPPYGLYSKTLAENSDLVPVVWSLDPRDWSVLNTASVVNYVVKKVKPDDVILLHDIFETSVDAALQIVDILLEQGYTFVTVDELLGINPKILLYQ